ncbi:MAG: recombinase family protein [Pseudonocardiales bacterium]|nr:MAG: recombinase family protein [Pseudonocardiales bacterium]
MGTRGDRRGDGSGRRLVLDSYARLSRNVSGELEKVEEQHADNQQVIERLGGVLGVELTDDDLSAWKPSVRRPDWERLLARLASGEADGAVVWHVDRLLRLPRDLERLLEFSDRGLTLGCAHGQWDLADPNDRFILRVEVAHACRSSDDASRRIRRRFETLRRNGVAHAGGRSFGFPGRERMPGADGARVEVPAEVLVAEQAAIRDATAAVLAGASFTSVAAEWNLAGLPTAGGKVWTPVLVREVLSRPRNAGLVEHDGVVVGQMPGEPIVDRGDFQRLRAMLSGRRRGRPPGERYTASGVLRCGLCGRGLNGRPHAGTYPDGSPRRQYHCNKRSRGCGGVAADVRAVDRELRSFVMRRLSDPRHAAAVAAARARVADRLTAVVTEIADCEAIGEALADRLGRREITLAAFDKANQPIAADLARLRAERDSLAVGEPAGPVAVLDAATVGAQWDAAEPAERRGLLVAALGSLHLVLDPAPKDGRRVFNPARVRLADPNTTLAAPAG